MLDGLRSWPSPRGVSWGAKAPTRWVADQMALGLEGVFLTAPLRSLFTLIEDAGVKVFASGVELNDLSVFSRRERYAVAMRRGPRAYRARLP